MRSLIATLSVAALLPTCALADVTTIGFAGLKSAPLDTANFTIDGYRFSPKCHVDHRTSPLSPDGATLGWDVDVCDTTYNHNYLGPAAGSPLIGELFVDHGGALFDVISFVGIGGDPIAGATFISSKGGQQAFTPPMGTTNDLAFSGDQWQGVEWIRILNGGGGPNWDLDSLTLATVPEPASWGLVALAIGGVAATRRQRRR